MPDSFNAINAHDLHEQRCSDHPPAVVDARSREAFESSHIPGAICIPSDQAAQLALEVLDRNQAIVVYCTDLDCSASPTLAGKLLDLGFADVTDFSGGLQEWHEAGFHVEQSREAAAST